MINSIVEFYKESFKNPVLSGIVSMYGITVVSFLFRSVPAKIYSFLKRRFVTTIHFTSANTSFYDILKHVDDMLKNKNYRTIKISNGRWGGTMGNTKSIGYGKHIAFDGRIVLLIILEKDENNKTEYDKEYLTISKIGRSHKYFDKMIKKLENIKTEPGKSRIYTFTGDYWDFCRVQRVRNFDTIFIPKEKKDLLINRIDDFLNNEELYKKRSIPYQLGIMLYGKPGTGKTSLVQAIAYHTRRNIYILDPSKLDSIDSAVRLLPENSILLIEDIDSNMAIKSRSDIDAGIVKINDDEPDNDKEMEAATSMIEASAKRSLSKILNSMDGIMAVNGRILITTTNSRESIDPAIMRPGRIDLDIEIGYMQKNEFIEYVANFYFKPKEDILNMIEGKNQIVETIIPAKLQELCMRNDSAEKLVSEYYR